MTTTTHVDGVIVRHDEEVDALSIDLEGAEPGASVRQQRLEGGRAVDDDAEGVRSASRSSASRAA